ncbi:tetratricopeptide repeat protein [Sphingobacterium psychroaquaticum]|uniref:tetratricopeptide repeat protein n=1 Tax=Sphingobacterium psychroaquaticum TaxID=561061 RepID=UPI001068F250|nr:tetratricopeptide repeat protein [Sphingobacterium psychroaquaticum]QBQ42107.1 tetratricopeptide repeat protein [Sphingobacterium psychroaquaticum]
MFRVFCFCCLVIVGNLVYGQAEELAKLQALASQQPDTALRSLRELYTKSKKEDHPLLEGEYLQAMGEICFHQGHYQQAMEFYFEAEKAFEKAGNTDFLAENYGKMGTLYFYNKQQDKAQQLFAKALTLYQKNKNEEGEARILGSIGQVYEKRQLYDSAFYYQKMALGKFQHSNNKTGAAKIYENLGSIYEDLERYDDALEHFNQSLNLYRADKNEIGTIEVINNLGDILRKTGQYTASIAKTKEALLLAEKTKNTYQKASATKDLGKTYGLMQQLDSAYHYAELSRTYSLEVYSQDVLKQTSFLQVLYDMNKQSDEIVRLHGIRKVNRVMIIASAVGAFLLIGLILVIVSRQRLKIRDQKNTAEKQKAEHALVQVQLEKKVLEEELLKEQLVVKGRELSTHTLNLIKNKQFLEQLRIDLLAMVKDERRDQKKQIQQLVQEIDNSFGEEQHWKEFAQAFEQVHQQFFEKLKSHSADLTAADLRLIALMKMNLNSAEIAVMLGISTDSLRVARYRLRKKLQMEQGDNLTFFIQSL